jgi:hypothetical protein
VCVYNRYHLQYHCTPLTPFYKELIIYPMCFVAGFSIVLLYSVFLCF